MSFRNGKKVTSFPGIHIRSRDAIRDAVIELSDVTTAPSTTTGFRYLYSESGLLKYDNGSSVTTLGAAGEVSNFSLNDALTTS